MIILQTIVKRLDLRSNPAIQYVFGDNEVRMGYGGQAGEMRGESNAVGIATLRASGIFWTDKDAGRQCRVIDGDLAQLLPAVLTGWPIVWPRDNIGTGLAQLPTVSPVTYAHLSARLIQMMEFKPNVEAVTMHDQLVGGEMKPFQITRALLGEREGLLLEDEA